MVAHNAKFDISFISSAMKNIILVNLIVLLLILWSYLER